MEKLIRVIARNLIFVLRGKGLGLIDKLRLKLKGRYTPMSVKINGTKFLLSDAASFVAMYEELFIKQIYAFNSDKKDPLIIDCGANIGLGIASYKRVYPNARVIAFEPDNGIFEMLKSNVEAAGYSHVEIVKKAIWISNEPLKFVSDGGLSGRLDEGASGERVITVEAQRLKEILNQPVDLLKIDIEGAEHSVIKDCADSFGQVKLLFVEYHSDINEPQHLQDILEIITKAGFRYHIQEAYVNQQPFLGIKPMLHMDLQLNIFAYRSN